MTKEYRAKVFKSGNSVPLRLPKAMGIVEGVRDACAGGHDRIQIEPVEAPKRKIDVSKFWGKAPWLTVPPQ